jgi:hypothetical protein
LPQQKRRWTGMPHGIIQNNSRSLFMSIARRVMPTYLREVLGDVQDIIEDAAQKDSYIAKTHKRLSTRLGFNVSSNASFYPNSPIAHRPSRGSNCDL